MITLSKEHEASLAAAVVAIAQRSVSGEVKGWVSYDFQDRVIVHWAIPNQVKHQPHLVLAHNGTPPPSFENITTVIQGKNYAFAFSLEGAAICEHTIDRQIREHHADLEEGGIEEVRRSQWATFIQIHERRILATIAADYG